MSLPATPRSCREGVWNGAERLGLRAFRPATGSLLDVAIARRHGIRIQPPGKVRPDPVPGGLSVPLPGHSETNPVALRI